MTGLRSISGNSASVNISKSVSSSSSKQRTDTLTSSPLGQDRATVLKKSREVWTESMANISSADEQPHYSKRAEQITPKALKAAQLKKVPVYMAARSLENQKTPNVHGFVAIGRPGQTGAKVFSHGTVNAHREITLSMDSFHSLMKKHDDGRDVFSSQCRRSIVLMLNRLGDGEKLHFKSFQDFHRAYFITEMRDFQDQYDPNDKEKFPNPGDYEKTLKHWQFRINAEAHNIYHVLTADPSCSGDSDGSDLRYVTPSGKYTTEEEAIELKHPAGDESVDEYGFGPPGTKYTHKINDNVNLGEMDARAFEAPDAEKNLTLNEQKSLKATDVLEAQQTQMLRRNFMDEKTRMADGLGLAPELFEPMNSEQDIQQLSERGQNISVKNGFWQHGVKTNVHWDPTPNLKRKPQTSDVLVTKGAVPQAEFDAMHAKSSNNTNDDFATSDPAGSGRFHPYARRMIEDDPRRVIEEENQLITPNDSDSV